jgi:pimeloyl-[acyl-carrier protein] methyl ester esterase
MVATVLLPGLDGTGQLLDAFAGHLGQDLHPIVVTYPPDVPAGYDQLAELVLRSLPRGEPFLLIAESFSGPVASRVAAMAPEGLIGIVFCASFVSSPLPALRSLAFLLPVAPVRSVPPALLAALLLGRWSTPQHVLALRHALRSVSPAVLRARARAALTARAPAPGSIHVPVLYLRAESDRLISPSSFERLRLVAPSATVESIHGPHFLLQAVPEACARAVRTFTSMVAPRF